MGIGLQMKERAGFCLHFHSGTVEWEQKDSVAANGQSGNAPKEELI